MAKELFNKLNKNKSIKADSSGVIKPEMFKELINDLSFVFSKYGIKRRKPKQLEKKVLKKQYMIIVVADDVPTSLFDSKKNNRIKILKWKTKDAYKYKEKTRRERLERVYLDIEKRIKKLIEKLA
jgi:protein-tyrosine-phosphatase